MRTADAHAKPGRDEFALDITLPQRLLADRGDSVEDGFTRAVLAIDGVASVFGVNDFVTVTRVQGADWSPIVGAVEDAAASICLRAPSARRPTPSSGHVSCCAKRRGGPRRRWSRFSRGLDSPETLCL